MLDLSAQTIGFLAILGLLVMIALRAPIAVAMIISGIAGVAAIIGWSPALSILESAPIDVARRYSFTMIPLFLLMGNLAVQSGLSADLFTASRRLLRRWRSGIPLASVSACGAFSAVSGSSLATAATMARVAVPEMLRNGYSKPLAAGTLAAGGTLGIMIPPSIALLLYALITEQSVGAMFMAGIVPGLVAFLLYCATVVILVARNPGQRDTQTTDTLTVLQAISKGIPVLVLFSAVMGGLYGGLFTPTEAAGAGAFLALLFALMRGMRWAGFMEAVTQTIRSSATIFLIIIGAEVFGYLLSISQITFELVDLIRSWELQSWQVLLIILGFFIIFGLFMDSLAIILLTVPIFFPLVLEMGINPIWFGILAVVAIEIGLITPPVGMNLFIIRSVAPEVSLRDVMVGVVPFVLADFVRLAILIAIPALSLAVPTLLGLT
jgi:tripartite ATP-independent transporter DctM subunit